MLKVIQMLARESPRTRLLLQIHDELLLEVPDEEIKTIAGTGSSGIPKTRMHPIVAPVQLMMPDIDQSMSCAVVDFSMIVCDCIHCARSTVKVKALLESASLLPCTLKVSVPCTPSQTLQCKVGRAWEWD